MAVDQQKTRNTQTRSKPGEADALDVSKEKRNEYLTARQLADVLQISESSVHRLRRTGRIPAILLTDRLIRFNLRDVQKSLRPTSAARSHSDGEDPNTEPDQSPSPQLSFGDLFEEFGKRP